MAIRAPDGANKSHLCSHIHERLQFEIEMEGEEEWGGELGRGPVEKFN